MRNWIFALVALLASPLSAQEQLVFTPPEGFVFAFQSEPGTLREWLPEGEDLQAWTRLVTHTVAPGLQVPALDFARAMAASGLQTCGEAYEATVRHQGQQNGYSILIFTASCPQHFMGGSGSETMFVKIIEGRDAMHTVQYAWRGELGDDEVLAAMQWTVPQILCDPREATSPCP